MILFEKIRIRKHIKMIGPVKPICLQSLVNRNRKNNLPTLLSNICLAKYSNIFFILTIFVTSLYHLVKHDLIFLPKQISEYSETTCDIVMAVILFYLEI